MKKFIYSILALSAVMLAACSSDEPKNPAEEQTPDEPTIENEAPKCDGSVTVMIPGQSRASSTTLGDLNIDRFTATRVDKAYSKYALVSYHGRLQEQIGMVQIIDPENNDVLSEIVFPDSRVNYCNIRNLDGKMTAYVAVDQVTKKGKHLCGVVCIPIKDNKFYLPGDATEAQIQPYYVDGVSVNCMKFIEQKSASALIVASGGNVALGETGKAGFTKFNINKQDPTKLQAPGNDKLDANFRGYWVSHNIATSGNVGMPVAYTYRTVENGELVWKVAVHKYSRVKDFFDPEKEFGEPDAEAVVMRKKDTTDDRSRFSVSMFLLKQGRFVVVSTGSKVLDPEVGEGGGVRVYRFDESGADDKPELCLVDVWNKACNNTSNMKVDGEEKYLFAACANGVFKCELDYYEAGFKANSKTPNRYVQLVPVEKRITDVMTESDTYASTNYVQCNTDMHQVHVAGGYEGYYNLDLEDDDFIPADPRTDLVKHE